MRVGMQGGARIVERGQQQRVQPGAQVRAVGRRRDLVERELQSRWRRVLQTQGRLAHLADAAANRGHQLREQPGVPAVQHLEFVLRLVGDARHQHPMSRPRDGVQALETADRGVHAEARDRRLINGTKASECGKSRYGCGWGKGSHVNLVNA
jgi:hypothetical protein